MYTLFLENKDVLEFEFSPETTKKIHHFLNGIPYSPYTNLEEFIVEACKGVSLLPSEFLLKLTKFRSWGEEAPGAILLKNMPLDKDLPNTPANARKVNKPSFISEASILLISSLIGQPFSYALEKNGEIIQNLCPVERQRKTASSEGFDYDLELHTDNAFHDARPDYLMLFCIRADHDKNAATFVSSIKIAYNKIAEEHRQLLRERLFLLKAPDSFNNMVPVSKPTSLIFGRETSPLATLSLNKGVVEPLTAKAQEAFAAFAVALRDLVHPVYLNPGDLLIINNYKVVHGRSSFDPRFDGQDRWLQRVYLRENLWKHPQDPQYPIRVLQ